MDKTMLKFKFEEKKKKVVDGAKNAVTKGVIFAKENPILASAIAMGTVKIVSNSIRFGQSCVVSKREKDYAERMDRTFYDPSTRHRWELKKPLTNKEWLNLETLKKESGKSWGEILRENNKLA